MTGTGRSDGNILITGTSAAQAAVLTDDALAFLTGLQRSFNARRRALLESRAARQTRLNAGTEQLDFLSETADIRRTAWTVVPPPNDLVDRRVEITGPVNAKTIINALNSGASAFMADFEDASSPMWHNMVEGQSNLVRAVRRTLNFADETSGKRYTLNDETAVLLVRPRGWHMEEAHLLIDGEPMSASLFDFGLFVFHNAHELLARGSGPYFYLPKLQSRHEAALWRDVFLAAERTLDLPRGSIRATILIETLPAAFEMDEILYEMREHIVGLNCGRWDYIFSMIKTLGRRADFVVPDRALVTMTSPALSAYSKLLIKTCHRRGAHAMGGMAAQIPIRGDEAANALALEKVEADKEREAREGHDGTWVAHPGLIPTALAAFNAVMPGANQVQRLRDDVEVSAADLTRRPEGSVTEQGLRHNIRVGIQYIAAWLDGQGCVPLYNLMEDAATAEICRAQIWQWRLHGVRLDSGRIVTGELLKAIIGEEVAVLPPHVYSRQSLEDARNLFLDLCLADDIEPFLTTPAYRRLLQTEEQSRRTT
ncbi:MAG: malate synthase A [Alphaproteobacteria bacterium]|nr:malate synthase A [Alphaproteobacteria bacterium]MDE2110486.1 malate synthase A [Alphaproteobacteria bacterium]MDE2493236.1 malate synthase A [Alphaproteobacteria bacterium]